MNTQKSSKMSYIIIAIVVVIALAIYFYWSGTKIPDMTLEETSNQVVGAKVFRLLNEINSIKIDTSFFQDSSYRTLRDYAVPIPSLPIGRSNPFAPLPGVLAPGKTATH